MFKWFFELEYGKDYVAKNLPNEWDLHNFRWSGNFRSGRGYNIDFYTAAVVRNPFSRLTSCYFDRIQNPKAQEHDPEFKTFKQWAMSLSTDRKVSNNYDDHWRPMSHELQRFNIKVNQFIQLEQLQADMSKFLLHMNLPQTVFYNSKAKDRLYIKPYIGYYDQETFEHVTQVYADDLEMLNKFYSNNYKDYHEQIS
jgi:hypothetical protein